MSKKQHRSQFDLRNAYRQDTDDVLEALSVIEDHEKKENKGKKEKKKKKEREVVEIELSRGDVFSPNAARNVLAARMKGKTDFAVFVNGKEMTLKYINKRWELNTGIKTLYGTKRELMDILCNDVSIAYND